MSADIEPALPDEYGVAQAIGLCSGKLALVLVHLHNHEQLTGGDADDASIESESIEDRFCQAVQSIVRPDDHFIELDASNHLLVLDNLIDENHAELAGIKLSRVFAELAQAVEPHDSSKCADQGPRHMQVTCGIVYVGRQPSLSLASQRLLVMARDAVTQAAQSRHDYCVVRADSGSDTEHEWLTNHRLREALGNHDVSLDYQPKVDLRSGEIIGAEALVRWRDRGTVVPPSEYLPILTNDLLWELAVYSFRRALREIPEFGIEVPVAINLDPSVLAREGFVDFAVNESRLWGVPAEQLVLEVIESSELFESEAALRQVAMLQAHGFQLALDEYRAGYADLDCLADLGAVEIKLERDLVSRLCACAAAETTELKSAPEFIQSALQLGVPLVADGVDDAQSMEALKTWGCTAGQGFYLGAPMPVEEFTLLVQSP